MKKVISIIMVVLGLGLAFAGGAFYEGQLTPPRVITRTVTVPGKTRTRVVVKHVTSPQAATQSSASSASSESPVTARDAEGNQRPVSNARATQIIEDEYQRIQSDEDKMYQAGLIGNNAYDDPQQ